MTWRRGYARQHWVVPVEKRRLSKEICMACHRANPRCRVKWSDAKDDAWESGIVYCCARARQRSIQSKPRAENCPFHLEHLLSLSGQQPPEYQI